MNSARYMVFLLLLAVAMTGCVTTINAKNARRHANAAEAARIAGDWTAARSHWGKAFANAQSAGTPDRQLAVYSYEYGRALGVQCFWEEAENYLQKAYALDHRSDGPEFMALLELARLKYDQKQYDQCIPYYVRAIEELEKFGAANKAPVEFSVVLDEYTRALRETRKHMEAIAVQIRANEIRSRFPEGQAITERTPYGTYCTTTGN